MTTGTHPARYTPSILGAMGKWIEHGWLVLDPFAGTGRIHQLGELTRDRTFGVEIEPEWATLHPRTIVGNALALPFRDGSFDAIATSPTYGNRMADHHDARDGSRRITYKHRLGRDLHPDNSGAMQWGAAYRAFHHLAWEEATRVARNRFLLNISDHVRGGEVMPVSHWHAYVLVGLGWEIEAAEKIETLRMRNGANANLRVDHEWLIIFRKATA